MSSLALRSLLRIQRQFVPKRGLRTSSYIRGSRAPKLLETTVGEHFSSIVSKFGDRNAVISRHQRTRLTYDALNEQSDYLASGLRSIGVCKGDRIAVSLGNNIEYAITTYALFKLGAILVPLNPAFNVHQVIAAINHLNASVFITGLETNLSRRPAQSNLDLLRTILPNIKSPDFESSLTPSLKRIVIVDNSQDSIKYDDLRALTKFNDVLEDGKPMSSAPREILSPDEIINIQFTSGTTSTPKAACLTHRSILNNGFSIGERMLLSARDIVCCPPPLFHCFGSILGYMATATHGSAIVFPSEAFEPLATLKAVQAEQATALYGVPTMFLACLELLQSGAVSKEGFGRLRTGIAAGSSIPAELMKKLHKVLNLTELTICYGMTETSPVSAMTTTDDPLEKRIHTVGRLLPHVEAKVVSSNNPNTILPVNSRGELAVAGYLLMKEYWGDPVRTAEALRTDKDGKVWMHTGDKALVDPDGYVHITGRLKDIIVRGGENIQPAEIEDALLAHARVAEAFVVGVPDERYGEVVAAFVVRRQRRRDSGVELWEGSVSDLLEETLRDWVRTRLSGHLVPKHVFWIESGDVPKTASGKVQKFLLRERATALVTEMNRKS